MEIKKMIVVSSSGNKFEFEIEGDEIVRCNGNEIKDIHLIEEDGFTFVEKEGTKYSLEIQDQSQNKYTVLINNVSYTFSVETPFSYKRRKMLNQQKQASKTVVISAPIPGKIVDILVEENQQVREGDVVIVLEAMKMQNEIASHVSGKVKKISVKKNDTVMKDDVMIEIER